MKLIGELKNDFEMDNDSFLICAEHTGQYTYPLACFVKRSNASCGWKTRPRSSIPLGCSGAKMIRWMRSALRSMPPGSEIRFGIMTCRPKK